MKSPRVGKPRSASGAFSLSRKLPRLQMPQSSVSTSRYGRPRLGKPGRSVFSAPRRRS